MTNASNSSSDTASHTSAMPRVRGSLSSSAVIKPKVRSNKISADTPLLDNAVNIAELKIL